MDRETLNWNRIFSHENPAESVAANLSALKIEDGHTDENSGLVNAPSDMIVANNDETDKPGLEGCRAILQCLLTSEHEHFLKRFEQIMQDRLNSIPMRQRQESFYQSVATQTGPEPVAERVRREPQPAVGQGLVATANTMSTPRAAGGVSSTNRTRPFASDLPKPLSDLAGHPGEFGGEAVGTWNKRVRISRKTTPDLFKEGVSLRWGISRRKIRVKLPDVSSEELARNRPGLESTETYMRRCLRTPKPPLPAGAPLPVAVGLVSKQDRELQSSPRSEINEAGHQTTAAKSEIGVGTSDGPFLFDYGRGRLKNYKFTWPFNI
jgi:hypothetical protein